MEESYIRFLRLWRDGFWLWKDVGSASFDFAAYVRMLDLPSVRAVAENANPPTGQDGAYEYQAGHFREADSTLLLTTISRIPTTSGAKLEMPWTGTVEIRSTLVLWFDAAKARFDFVHWPENGPVVE
jgi:hypothetical protein